MRITELARRTGTTVDELRYLEKKGFVCSTWLQLKQRRVRQYQDADVRKLELTIKYRRQGFTWDVSYQKAMEELRKPRLFDVSQ